MLQPQCGKTCSYGSFKHYHPVLISVLRTWVYIFVIVFVTRYVFEIVRTFSFYGSKSDTKSALHNIYVQKITCTWVIRILCIPKTIRYSFAQRMPHNCIHPKVWQEIKCSKDHVNIIK